MRPRTSIRGHVRWLVGWSVGWSVGRSVTQTFEMRKTADSDVFLHSYHLSCLTTFIFIHSIIHLFIHSFIYIFIHSSKTFIHKNLIKRGALIGLHLALLYLFSTGYQKSYWLIFIKPKEKETFIGSDHLSRLISNDHRCGHDDDNLKRHE